MYNMDLDYKRDLRQVIKLDILDSAIDVQDTVDK